MRRGGLVLVVGPDGAGKTAVRHALVQSAPYGLTVETDRRSMLPRRTTGIVTEPHQREPYPPLLSAAKALYYFVDALLDWVVRVRPTLRTGTWLVRERGWWDMTVDPRRYRLQPHPHLLRTLGRLLPRPDLILVLEGAPTVIRTRKQELTEEEIARQGAAWHSALPARQRRAYLDVSLPLDEVVRRAWREIESLAGVAASPAPVTWTALPGRGSPRWILPRAPRSVARSALRIYHPVTLRGYAGWMGARAIAAAGGFRMLPAGPAPNRLILDLLRPYMADGTTVALARPNHEGRHTALLVGGDGRVAGIAKLASTDEGRAALRREAEAIGAFGPYLSAPLFAPRILDRGDDVLLLDAVDWRPRARAWRVPEDVAAALGRFFAAGARDGDARGFAHGDFAPWNLLRTADGWVLLDWEEARGGVDAFSDLFHYLIQSTTLLGRPSKRALMRGLEGEGWIGCAIAAFAAGAGRSPAEARGGFELYLEESVRRVDLSQREGAMSVRFRAALLGELQAGRVEA